MTKKFAEFVEEAVILWGYPSVPREFIEEALQRIKEGKETAEIYLGGNPAIRDVYIIAARLHAEVATKN